MEQEKFINDDSDLNQDQNLEQVELCSNCAQEPVFLEGLCEYCYEEEVVKDFEDDEEKEIIPKHGRSLMDNPDLQRDRSVKKVLKVSRKK